MKFKLGQVVKFYKAQDDSAQASDCFGFDPSCGNDWFSVQYYPEQVYGVITKIRGTILAQMFFLNRDGERQFCDSYDLSKTGIEQRVLEIQGMLEQYNLTEKDFFEDCGFGFEVFAQVEIVERVGGGV